MKYCKLTAQHSIRQKEEYTVNYSSELFPSLGCIRSHLPHVSSLHLFLLTPGYLWPCHTIYPQYIPHSKRTVSNCALQVISIFFIFLTTNKTALCLSLSVFLNVMMDISQDILQIIHWLSVSLSGKLNDSFSQQVSIFILSETLFSQWFGLIIPSSRYK